jgi:hypothetical protein
MFNQALAFNQDLSSWDFRVASVLDDAFTCTAMIDVNYPLGCDDSLCRGICETPPLSLTKFIDKVELQTAVLEFTGDRNGWAGSPSGIKYGYAQLLTRACASGENKVVNGGSPFAFVSTIIAVLRSMNGMSVTSRTSVKFFRICLVSMNPLVAGMFPRVPYL